MTKDEKYYTIWIEGKTFTVQGRDIDYRLEELDDRSVCIRWEEGYNNWTSTYQCDLRWVLQYLKDGTWVIIN